jgi:hypothetical protein
VRPATILPASQVEGHAVRYENESPTRQRGRGSKRTETQIRFTLAAISLGLAILAAIGTTLALAHGPELHGARVAFNVGLVCIVVATIAAATTAILTVGLALYRAIKDLKRLAYEIRDELVTHMDDETRALNSVAALASKEVSPFRRHG